MMKHKIISSLLYQFAERLLVKGLGLIISIILARLLSPTEFGQVALMMVFVNVSIVFVDSGLNSAIVQNKDTSEGDYSTVFYLSLLVAFALIAVLYFTAPFIADYYNDLGLVKPLRVYSISLLFGVVKSITQAKLQREMRFKQMMWSNLLACVLSGIIGVLMAYMGHGIWALISYYLSSQIITTILYLIVTRWYPKLYFSYIRAKVLFSFGWRMSFSSLLCSMYYDIRSLIIGKVYSPAQLGYYNRGEQFPLIVSQTIDGAIQAVMFPVMSSVQETTFRVKEVLQRTFSIGALIVVPIMFAMAIMSEDIIECLLTSKWLPAVPYMQCICVGCATIPLTSSCLVAIKSLGRSDVYLRLEIFRRAVMMIILVVSVFCFESVLAIAVGFSLSSWVDYIIISIVIHRLLDYHVGEQLRDVWKPFVASGLMCLVLYCITWFNIHAIWILLLQFVAGISVYVLLCYALKIHSYNYLIKQLQIIVRSK